MSNPKLARESDLVDAVHPAAERRRGSSTTLDSAGWRYRLGTGLLSQIGVRGPSRNRFKLLTGSDLAVTSSRRWRRFRRWSSSSLTPTHHFVSVLSSQTFIFPLS